ncbi:MAG: class I SAM-dependent methyltransferase [Solirubrobacteraceae bacterium]
MDRPQDCPLCGGPLSATSVRAIDRLVTGDGPFAVLECRACRLGVTDLHGVELERYYGGSYFDAFYEHESVAASSPLEALRRRYRRRSAARRFGRAPLGVAGLAPGRVLDVGCGGGELLAYYAARGWESFGIDPSSSAARAARARGATVHQGTLADQPWAPGSFDIVVFSHSLEHIPEPLAALLTARELLAPGGRLAIAAPNWRCWQRSLFGGFWFPLDLPRHLQHFSPRALAVLARILELDVVSIGTSSTIIAPTYSLHYLIAGRWTPGWKLWLAYALGAAVFPLFLALDRLLGADACYAALRRPDAPTGDTPSADTTL